MNTDKPQVSVTRMHWSCMSTSRTRLIMQSNRWLHTTSAHTVNECMNEVLLSPPYLHSSCSCMNAQCFCDSSMPPVRVGFLSSNLGLSVDTSAPQSGLYISTGCFSTSISRSEMTNVRLHILARTAMSISAIGLPLGTYCRNARRFRNFWTGPVRMWVLQIRESAFSGPSRENEYVSAFWQIFSWQPREGGRCDCIGLITDR